MYCSYNIGKLFLYLEKILSLLECFNEPKDIFPSDIGEETDFSRPSFLVGDKGELISRTKLFNDEQSVYYCWWD